MSNSQNERKKVIDFLKGAYRENSDGMDRALGSVLDRNERRDVMSALHNASQQNGLLRPGYSRSTMSYVEKDDPRRKHCEQVIFTINLSAQELQYPLDPEVAHSELTEDGRTLRRLCWDGAVTVMTRVLNSSGLQPKFMRNDKNSCRLHVAQEYLAPGEPTPDEFFALEMYYCSEGELESRKLKYVRALAQFAQDIEAKKQRLYSFWTRKDQQKLLLADIAALEAARAQYMTANADPRELDAGLVLHVDVCTTRGTGFTKGRVSQVLSEFINSLSRVAAGHVKLVYPSRTVTIAEAARDLRKKSA